MPFRLPAETWFNCQWLSGDLNVAAIKLLGAKIRSAQLDCQVDNFVSTFDYHVIYIEMSSPTATNYFWFAWRPIKATGYDHY